MKIWRQQATLEEINLRGEGTMVEHLNIHFTAISDTTLTATMPVDHRTKQPLGLLHGGASVALAETVGSTAANLCVDPAKAYCVGLDINANHIRGMRDGIVTGIATPLHLGKKTHVWEIRISNSEQQLISLSRLTVMVLSR